MKPIHEMSIDEAQTEAARRADRRARGLPLTPSKDDERLELEVRAHEDDARKEKEIQREVMKLYRAFGCAVYNLSQARASKQTPGLPDLWAFWEEMRCEGPVGWWHEVKTPTGRSSDAQLEFQIRCKQVGIIYVLGGVAAAAAHMVKVGIAQYAPDGTLERPQ